jgi:hypothetical protein
VLKWKILVKARCESVSTTACKIHNEEQAGLVKKHNFTNAAVAQLAPSFRRMESCLKKRRAKTRPRLPASLKDVKLTDQYTMTLSKARYLILNSTDGLACLSDTAYWHGDGTFHVAAKYFYQLYIIHAWFKDRMIPCAFALMHRRRSSDYVKVLKALVKEASTTGKILKPQIIMTDFESAAIKAFKQVFSGIISKGCMFHLGQNFMKRLRSIGLKTRYSEDLTFKRWINSVFG